METRIPGDTSFDTHFLEETSLEDQYPLFHIPISWSAIFAGLVTALATSICLSFLVAALGLGHFDLYSSSPFKSTLFSVGIGSLIIMLISLAGGSFVAGRFAEASGAIHGFLTWALLTLIMAIQTILFISSSAHLGAQAVSSNIAETKQSITDKIIDIIPFLSRLDNENFESLLRPKNDNGIDFDQLHNEIYVVLNNNEIPALNPERLKQSYQEALEEIDATITAFKNDPSHYSTYLKDLKNYLSSRAQAMNTHIDKKAIIDSLITRGVSHSDAQKMANHALDLYHSAETKTEKAIKALEEQANLLSQKINLPTKDSSRLADKAVNTASNIGWWGFLGGLIGAIISSIFGYYGYRSRKHFFMP
ncbi:DUF3792 domain-containing protein [Bartonella sp. B41]